MKLFLSLPGKSVIYSFIGILCVESQLIQRSVANLEKKYFFLLTVTKAVKEVLPQLMPQALHISVHACIYPYVFLNGNCL